MTTFSTIEELPDIDQFPQAKELARLLGDDAAKFTWNIVTVDDDNNERNVCAYFCKPSITVVLAVKSNGKCNMFCTLVEDSKRRLVTNNCDLSDSEDIAVQTTVDTVKRLIQ
jgi:hypothetical protein